MIFEPLACRATPTPLIAIGAPPAIPFTNHPLDRCRDIPSSSGRVAHCDVAAGGSGRAEATGLELRELLGHGVLDNYRDVAVRDCRAHEGPKPFELVVQLGACCELDLVASGGERFNEGRRGRRGLEDRWRRGRGGEQRRHRAGQAGNSARTEFGLGVGFRARRRATPRRFRQLAHLGPDIGPREEIGQELLDRAAGACRQLGQPLEQIVVGNLSKRSFVVHADNIGRRFATSRTADLASREPKSIRNARPCRCAQLAWTCAT
jgi:hypothetical protein